MLIVGVFLLGLGVADLRRRRRAWQGRLTTDRSRWEEAEEEVLRPFAGSETERRPGKSAEAVCEERDETPIQKTIRDSDSSTR
jgi:hypothetical protein